MKQINEFFATLGIIGVAIMSVVVDIILACILVPVFAVAIFLFVIVAVIVGTIGLTVMAIKGKK